MALRNSFAATMPSSTQRLSPLRMRRCRVESLLLLLMCICLTCAPSCVRASAAIDDSAAAATGYSYSRFVGPVNGPEQRVYVHDAFSGGTRLDYIARPEYQFAYGVEDADAHVLHNRQETRDGNAVEGVYSVVDPDGSLRVVKYTADDLNGFQAEVITNGVPILHGGIHVQPQMHTQMQEHVITAPGPQTPSAHVEQRPQYQVHETPPSAHHSQQQQSQHNHHEQAQEDDRDVKDHKAAHNKEVTDNNDEGDDEEEDEEGEGEEAYTSYEDASQEVYSNEANSDEDEY